MATVLHYRGMSTLITTVAGNNGKAPMAILWAPKGEHTIQCSLNGRPGTCVVRVTSGCIPRLNADLEAKLSGNVKPVGLYDHEMGPASYRPARFVWDEEKGVVLELEGWTEKGKADVEGGNYGYHSPRFRRDKGTGEILGLLPESIEVGSLVNDPAFDDIERIAASRTEGNVAHFDDVEDSGNPDDNEGLGKPGEGLDQQDNHTTNRDMDITKLVAFGILTEEEAKAENAEAIALERIKALQDKSKASSDELEARKKELEKCQEEIAASRKRVEERAAQDVADAIAAGKLAPKDEAAQAFWKRALTEDYIAASKQLNALPKNPAFDDVEAGKPNGAPKAPVTGTAALRNSFETELNNLNK